MFEWLVYIRELNFTKPKSGAENGWQSTVYTRITEVNCYYSTHQLIDIIICH